jgi:hypothetical protein
VRAQSGCVLKSVAKNVSVLRLIFLCFHRINKLKIGRNFKNQPLWTPFNPPGMPWQGGFDENWVIF